MMRSFPLNSVFHNGVGENVSTVEGEYLWSLANNEGDSRYFSFGPIEGKEDGPRGIVGFEPVYDHTNRANST